MYDLYKWQGTYENKILLIKELRYLTGIGLKEAKDAVEGFLSNIHTANLLAIPVSYAVCKPEESQWKLSLKNVPTLDAGCYLSEVFTEQYKLAAALATNAFLRNQLNDAREELARLKSTRDLSNLLAGMLQTALNADGYDPHEFNAMRDLLDKLINHNNLFPRSPDRTVTFTVPAFGWYDESPLPVPDSNF
jgi:hypothetical protein